MLDKNTPLFEEDGLVVLVKAYDGGSWKLNSAVEFIGVVSPLEPDEPLEGSFRLPIVV